MVPLVLTDASADVFVSYSPAEERWATWIAWQLGVAGYRVLVEAWDRGPGEDVEAFVRRGVQTCALTVAVWSRTYTRSRSGAAWDAATRRRPVELLVVRVDDCPRDLARSGGRSLDLSGLIEADAARNTLLARLRVTSVAPAPAGVARRPGGWEGSQDVIRRINATEPNFPPAHAAQQERSSSVTILHVAGPRFGAVDGSGAALTADELGGRIWGSVTGLCASGAPRPDLLVVSGDLMATGKPTQMKQAESFLTGLRVGLELPPDRLIVVPGTGDVSPELCRAYIDSCRAAERDPVRPYFAKLAYFAELFGLLYGDLPDPPFVGAHPWTLFELPELRLVVAGLNSTMANTHRPEDDYGLVDEGQAGWFATRLEAFQERGWLRIGAVRHDPVPARDSPVPGPTVLRDADTLRRVLGGRLNLLLHGPGTGGDSIAGLGSTMHVVPATAPGRFELIHVTAEGLRRFSPDEPDGHGSRLHWHDAAATFAPVHRTPEHGDAGPRTIEILEPVLDPQQRLLRRIEEVVRARHERVIIRQVQTKPPHLLVTSREEGLSPQWAVGAHIGEVTAELVDEFLRHAPGGGSELVYEGDRSPPRALKEQARRRGVLLRSFIEFQGLLDLTGYVARQSAQLRADRRYPPELYVPQGFRRRNGHAGTPHADLAAELQKMVTADEGCFALVLGDFGRGKSFVLREVTRRLAEDEPHLIPILVDLRALDKATTVRGLMAMHLADEPSINFNAFDYMLREGRIVLLFDGFDELVTRLTYECAIEHLRTLLAAATGKAKIIVACRTQHFRSHTQVFEAMGGQTGPMTNWCVLEVERFTIQQIHQYLVKRYGGDEERATARLDLMRKVGAGEVGDGHLVELAQNPRMLSFVADLDVAQLRTAATDSKVISAARLYERLLGTWLAYEVERTAGQPGAAVTLLLDDLWRAVKRLALRLWQAGESQLRLAELDEFAETLSDLAGGRLSAEQTAHAVGSGSLLVRTEEDLFGFIHRSVTDWLVAKVIADSLAAGVARPPELAAGSLSGLAVDFLCDLAPAREYLAWVGAVDRSPDAAAVERRNAEAVSGRLRTPPGADLRGTSLVGEELSYRRFDGVDLTGADLSGARLVGADLRRAVLRDALLVGSQLDEAQLLEADLTGADLSRARLARADLTGATLTGSRWRRAALIHTQGIAADAPQLRGAAIAPGAPVGTEFAPAAVGVRHGFDPGHGRLPEMVSYSPAGDLVAIGNDDGGVLVCDTATGQPVRTLQGHRGRVFAVEYGEDTLVTGSHDGTVRVWDAATGADRHVLGGHGRWTWPLLLDPSGTKVVSGDADGVLRVWNVATGELLHTLPGGRGLVYTAVCCGELVAAGYREGGVRLWDTDTGICRREFAGGTGPIYRLVTNAAGDLLATGGGDGAVSLWHPSTGRKRCDLVGHRGRVYSLAFHPREPRLASGDTEGSVLVWDTTNGALLHRLSAHEAAVYSVAFSVTGELATGDRAGAVLLWDATSGELRQTLTGHTGSVWPFRFRPDGGQLAVSDDQFSTRLWDPTTGACRHILTGHARQVRSVRFSADGATLAASGNDGIVRLWDPVTGRQRRRLGDAADRLQRLASATFSPSGNRLVTVSNDRRLNLRNLDSDRLERHLDVESAPIWAVAFSPSGEELATANDDDTVQVWYRATGTLVHTLAEHRGRVRSIAFSADGALIATGCDDKMVRLWDAGSGRLLQTLSGHEDRVYAVAFGEGCLASASWDSQARIWDIDGGETRHVLGRHTGRLWTAAFAPDGRRLATAGDDLAIRLWDARDGTALHVLHGHTRSIWSLSFSPAGDLLASGGDDGTTRLWSLGAQPAQRLTLLGLPQGWAALAPDGRYKLEGTIDEAFWYVIGMCRFEIGELDPYLPEVRRLPRDAPF